MMFAAPGNEVVRPKVPDYTKGEIISQRDVARSLIGNQIKLKPPSTKIFQRSMEKAALVEDRIRLDFPPHSTERKINLRRAKLIGTNFEEMIRILPPDFDNDIIVTKNHIEKISERANSLNESSVSAVEIAESLFCVSSEDGQKMYQSIRSGLSTGKNILISFEGVVNISSAFLDEAIGNLYNGEFGEEDLKRINYRGEFRLTY
jgi:hypothetical protein